MATLTDADKVLRNDVGKRMATALETIAQGSGGSANANIADEYDSSHTYNTGNRVIYEGVLYVCNDDNVTGAWDSTKWDSATIDEIISALTAADIPYSAGVSVADKIDDVESTILTVHSKNVSVTFDSSGEGAVSDANIKHIIAVEDMMSDSGIYPAYIAYMVRGGDWRIKSMNRSNLNFTSNGIISSTRTVKIYYLA